MKKIFAVFAAAFMLTGCAGNTTSQPESSSPETENTSSQQESSAVTEQTESAAATEEPAVSRTEEAADSDSPITVNYAEDVNIPEGAEVFEFSTAGALQPVQTIFTASRTVADLKVLALTYEDMDEDGNVTFSVEELMTIPKFTADSVLNASLEYIGTIPNNGISYTDPETGDERRFAVNMSGKDGSLFLWEF